jgi:acid stress-induced BolA-like protein IbaG/YrbA
MQPEQVKAMLEAAISDSEASVSGDGSHFRVTIISESFDGLSSLKRQQKVMAALFAPITSGEIHAIDTMEIYTRAEWQRASQLRVGQG